MAEQGAAYSPAFRMHTIAHHREGIQMIDQFLPRLTRPELRTMAERMKADQAADMQKLEPRWATVDVSVSTPGS